ncbi:20578_t:CDS:1, partial [Racocetra persica]
SDDYERKEYLVNKKAKRDFFQTPVSFGLPVTSSIGQVNQIYSWRRT